MTNTRLHNQFRKKGVRINSRDGYVLTQIIRYGALTVPLLQADMGMSRSSVYGQTTRLVRAGLLEDLRTGPSNRVRPNDVPALLVATKQAHRYLGINLPCRPMPLARVHHSLGVAQVGLGFMRAGLTVMTDREIDQRRRAWAKRGSGATPTLAPWLASDRDGWFSQHLAWGPHPAPAIQTHVPDLGLDVPNRASWAVEVEFSRKNSLELKKTLRVYALTSRYVGVIYYCRDDEVGKHVKDAFDSMDAAHQPNLTIRRLIPAWSERLLIADAA